MAAYLGSLLGGAARRVARQVALHIGISGASQAAGEAGILSSAFDRVGESIGRSGRLARDLDNTLQMLARRAGVPLDISQTVNMLITAHEGMLRFHQDVIDVNRELERGGGLTRQWLFAGEQGFQDVMSIVENVRREYMMTNREMHTYMTALAATGARARDDLETILQRIIINHRLWGVEARTTANIFRNLMVNLGMSVEEVNAEFETVFALAEQSSLRFQDVIGYAQQLVQEFSRFGVSLSDTMMTMSALNQLVEKSPLFTPDAVREVGQEIYRNLYQLQPLDIARLVAPLSPEQLQRVFGGIENMRTLLQELRETVTPEQILGAPEEYAGVIRRMLRIAPRELPAGGLVEPRLELEFLRRAAPELFERGARGFLDEVAMQTLRQLAPSIASIVTTRGVSLADIQEAVNTGRLQQLIEAGNEAAQRARDLEAAERQAMRALSRRQLTVLEEIGMHVDAIARRIVSGAARAQALERLEARQLEAANLPPEEVQTLRSLIGEGRLSRAWENIRPLEEIMRLGAEGRTRELNLVENMLRTIQLRAEAAGVTPIEYMRRHRETLTVEIPGLEAPLRLAPRTQEVLEELFRRGQESFWERLRRAFEEGTNLAVRQVFQTGGPVLETGPALVHAGEWVLSPEDIRRAFGLAEQVSFLEAFRVSQELSFIQQKMSERGAGPLIQPLLEEFPLRLPPVEERPPRTLPELPRVPVEIQQAPMAPPALPRATEPLTVHLENVIEPTPITVNIHLTPSQMLAFRDIIEREINQSRISTAYTRSHTGIAGG